MMTENPKVSVCIPNYNYGRFISDTIQSVLNQSFLDFELIVVDNCSTDNSEETIKGFTDKRIKFVKNNENIGAIKNANKCISLARGEYIFILHADDGLMPNMLEKYVQKLDSIPNVGLVCSSYIVKKGNETKLVASSNEDYIGNGIEEFKKHVVKGYLTWATMMTRSKCYEDVGLYDEKMGYVVDGDMIVRLLLKYDLAYISEPMVWRTSHATSWGHSYNDYYKMNMAAIDYIKLLRKTFTNLPSNLENLKFIERLAMKELSKQIVISAYFNLMAGRNILARRDIMLAISIYEGILASFYVYLIYSATFLGGIGRLFIKNGNEIAKKFNISIF